MKKLAAQALAFQYQLQLENAQAILNANNAALDTIDKALKDIIETNQKLQMINGMMENDVFYRQQDFPSWVLNETTWTWESPIGDAPTDGIYSWDEEAYNEDNTTGWVLVHGRG